MFTSFGFKWPGQLAKLFAASSMSSFNDQLMAPECSVGAWNFEYKWIITQSVPLVFVFALVLVIVIDAIRV